MGRSNGLVRQTLYGPSYIVHSTCKVTAIARAILQSPSLLLLDEATSSLDAESEHLVQEALDRWWQSSGTRLTVVVIAHRLSTVKKADQVVVIDQGNAVEQGTHQDLMQQDRLYAHLVRRQLIAEVDN